MTDINLFARQQAEAAAATLWALGSAPFPLENGALVQDHIRHLVTDTAISFAIHARRLLDNKTSNRFSSISLDSPFWDWEPAQGLIKTTDFREALNRIVHATTFEVGFERLPEAASKIDGGAVGVIYLKARTDRYPEALIDVFSLASCFFARVLPVLSP